MSVTQDPYSRKYVPASTAEWTELLSGLGINAPTSIWLCQEASGNLADSGSGGRTVTVSGSPAYAQSASGWQRNGIKPTDGSATQYGSCTIPNVNASSALLLQMFSVTSTATAARGLNRIGTATAEHATLQAGNKLRATSDASTSTGVQQHAGVMVVVTKFDRASSVLGVYTQHEQLKPTYSAPASSTTLYLFGDGSAASDATLVYAALWTGSDAEISDAKVQDLLDAIEGEELTIEKLEAGSFARKWVVAIEGCPYLISDAPSAAVLAAYAGRDWTQVLGGLRVELNNDQSIKPFEPFTSTGSCTIRVQDEDGTDVFGKFVARRAGGDETTITSTVDRNDTTINVRSTSGFDSSGEVYIGTECIGYTGTTASSFTGCTRGKYSPLGAALSGSGGARFGNHHRVGTDSNHVQMNPVVSSIPRVWLNKRVVVNLHTWDAVNQTINARAEAQRVFAGRISGISDDHNDVGTTIIEIVHAMDEMRNATVFRDQLIAEIAPGLAVLEGKQFVFTEGIGSSAANVANELVVVAGTPANTNEMQAGTYEPPELCEVLNRWLGGELAAGRIDGHYSWSIATSSDGIRARCHWVIENASSTLDCGWVLGGPAEVMSFLGLTTAEPDPNSATVGFPSNKVKTNTETAVAGPAVPFRSLVFRPFAARLGLEFSGSPYLDLDNVRGTFVDQYSRLPASIKGSCDPTAEWGLFLLDDKVLMVGTYDDSTQRLRNCWLAPFPMTANNDTDALGYMGRRYDEPDAGPVSVRQILAIEGNAADLLLELLYSTGVAGYNHATYDSLAFGIGVGINGELLGPEFERAVWNLPGASAPLMLLVDEPTRLSDLIGGDLNFRWAFVRWKDQCFGISNWKTPLNALAVATLTEDNKAAPAGANENHRVASQETSEHQYAIVKVDYMRDYGVSRNGDYLKSVKFEDQTAVDDSGGGARTATIELRNTFVQYANTGAAVEQGLPEFMVHMPSISRSSRALSRSLAPMLFESIAPGDIVTVSDNHARDPLTGERGVNSRAAFVTRVAYDLGGSANAAEGSTRPMDSQIEVNFLDTQRGREYAPAVDVDDTATNGGYDSATFTLTCYEHHYSQELVVPYTRGTLHWEEDADASYFPAGSEVLIVERDPADPASPTYWERTVASQSGNTITLSSALSLPAWDSAKKYRIVPRKYSEVATAQLDYAYQADDATELVGASENPWHFSAGEEAVDFVDYDNSTELAEFVPDLCFGDERPWDCGHDQAIARTLNQFIDAKSAHQAPYLHNATLGLYDEATSAWFTMAFGPVFLGTEHLSTTITRVLTVAPFFRSGSGGTAKLRITIMRSPPIAALGIGFLPGEQYKDSVFTDAYSQSQEYTTTSTTWQTGADAELSLDTKDIFFGFVYVLIEGQGDIECRGLAKCVEGPREVI